MKISLQADILGVIKSHVSNRGTMCQNSLQLIRWFLTYSLLFWFSDFSSSVSEMLPFMKVTLLWSQSLTNCVKGRWLGDCTVPPAKSNGSFVSPGFFLVFPIHLVAHSLIAAISIVRPNYFKSQWDIFMKYFFWVFFPFCFSLYILNWFGKLYHTSLSTLFMNPAIPWPLKKCI